MSQSDLPPPPDTQRDDTLRRLVRSRQALADEFELLLVEYEQVVASRE